MLFTYPALLKYAFIFTGVSSATVTPLIYSLGVVDTFSRGGHSYSPHLGTREAHSTIDTIDFEKINAAEANWAGLSINHAFYEHMKKAVPIEEFRKIYGALSLKEEDFQGNRVKQKGGPRGTQNMSILDAWEKFFSEGKSNTSEGIFSYFKPGGEKLPFWNYDYPYVAVEFPRELKLPEGLVQTSLDKGWIKIDGDTLPTEFDQHSMNWKGLSDSSHNFKRILDSKGYEREEYIAQNTLNKIMRASPDAHLYLVTSPEKLLRLWLGDWSDSALSEVPVRNEYALFKNNHFKATADHPEVTILTRWHKDRTYRMWLHHKPLVETQVKTNSKVKSILAGKHRFSVDKAEKRLDPKLKWGDNFLLNLMTWYAYTYKLSGEASPDKITYQTLARVGAWNLLDIYDLDRGANSRDRRYRDNFARWIADWYSGDNLNSQRYWKNVYNKFNLTDMRHFGARWERIKWIGQTMDELAREWGQVNNWKPRRT
ncbi:hypothetical protein [Candidatus Mycoplasma haematominutum]|uniref:Uncharacterized protein n=1 Tax=Candidatus Mycoplasma haematominutum 'Birmingham 1' TaxID=1116213 RepID=G8C3D9_9MOLU|nr:hypothetical protein [Candidatus Mycoplasma haematominutum]CCE66837.1 hypothetical protein MHM_03190 [Candidatus Mycoplasma haematominutum 'Birmingham 1']